MMSNKRLVFSCAGLFILNALTVTLFIKYAMVNNKVITIDEMHSPVAEVADDFLSFGIDSSEIERLSTAKLSNKRLRALASALSPARLRLGGTMSERLIFTKELDTSLIDCTHCLEPSAPTACKVINKLCKKKFLPFFLMTAGQWEAINNFCIDTNLKLLFSLNVLLREANAWDDTNAKEILNHSKFHGYKIDWQLGNEPNSFPHTFNISIPPKQLARDFRHLRRLLNEFGFENALLVGPDTTRPQQKRPECVEYMEQFLGNNSHGVNVRSWHQYYLNSRTAHLDDFWNPATFDLFKSQIDVMKKHTRSFNWMPMWLSETSSAYGGGAPYLSDTFSSSPLWMDKLGLAARHNITTVIRQSFIGGNYSLVDADLNPLPDWWVSLLFKKLVGNKVLKIKQKSSKSQRFYAHCTKSNFTNGTKSITLFGLNLDMTKLKFKLNGTALTAEELLIDEYVLRAPSNYQKSKIVTLNGQRLIFKDDAVPEIKPRRRNGRYIMLQPFSVGFWVIKNTSMEICGN